MNQCLGDENLWLLYEGGGSSEDRAHANRCAKCSARLRQLTGDLQVLSQVLRETPPVAAVSRPQRVFAWRWVPVAATCAAVVTVIWSGVFTPEPPLHRSTVSTMLRNEEVVEMLENEVASALFMNEDLEIFALPARVSTLTYMQTALDGGWPCERVQPFNWLTCDQRPFFLMTED